MPNAPKKAEELRRVELAVSISHLCHRMPAIWAHAAKVEKGKLFIKPRKGDEWERKNVREIRSIATPGGKTNFYVDRFEVYIWGQA